MKRVLAAALLAAAALVPGPVRAQAPQPTRLLRQPTSSATEIAFAYANDIWAVPRAGGEARRLTSFEGQESDPHFSPDGKWVAFTAQYGGNTDVYVVAAEGGTPRRLTWHPGADQARGWTPDGRRVVFASSRVSAPDTYDRLWTVSVDGGMPELLPMWRGEAASYSPDGARIAYQPINPWEQQFRNYRGGQNRPIFVMDVKTDSVQKLQPWANSRDQQPVWIGHTVYFISDRDFAGNVWAYDTDAGKLTQVTHHTKFDVQTLGGGGGVVVYEQAGRIHLYDPATGKDAPVDIVVRGDFPWAMPHWEGVADDIASAALSPTGVRALFGARGDVFTVPTDKGDWRNLTHSSGTRDREPAWAPDGKQIAWFSDASGEYQLMIGDQDGLEKPRAISLPHPTFYYTLAWSPDSKKVLFTDADLNLWVVDVASGKATKADQDGFSPPERTMDPVWSPDSRFIAFARRLNTQYHAIVVYDTETGRSTQLTDGMSDAVSPAWDASGKYLYFLASTDFGLNSGWLDMSSDDHPVRRGVYFAVLSKDAPSPLLPESDEEKAGDAAAAGAGEEKPAGKEAAAKGGAKGGAKDAGAAAKRPAPPVRIDFAGISQRILALPVPLRDYSELRAGVAGQVFWREGVQNKPGDVLHRYDLKKRKAEEIVPAVAAYAISADGKKLLYAAPRPGPAQFGARPGAWFVVDADKGPAKPGDGKLAVESLRARIVPQEEWHQIFREAWRIERDYFYVKNLHGADWDAVYKMYAPLVDDVRYRSDLTYLTDMLGGELSVGHSFVGDGDHPEPERVPIGLLGADLEVANGLYRIAHIYTGENWNPELHAPLSEPGVKVSEGDYILAVNGEPLAAPTNPYSAFEGTAGRQTELRVNSKPTMAGSWTINVVPVPNEAALRSRAWVEHNRAVVDSLSHGQLAYVWLPNTAGGGYTYFNRYYFAQQDRPGAVIDERFNHGGQAADYIIDVLDRKLHGYFNNPVGQKRPWTSPGAGIWGPKVMIANEMSGSGGDLLPYMYKEMKIGPLVGTRTWGGLVGILGCAPAHGRRLHHLPARRVLQPRRPVGCGEQGRHPRHRGRADLRRHGRGPRPPARGRRGRRHEAAPGAPVQAAAAAGRPDSREAPRRRRPEGGARRLAAQAAVADAVPAPLPLTAHPRVGEWETGRPSPRTPVPGPRGISGAAPSPRTPVPGPSRRFRRRTFLRGP